MRRHVPLQLLVFLFVASFASDARADESEDRTLAHVTKIGGRFTREDLPLKNGISNNLNDTAATDGDLEVIGGLSNLQALDLRSTKITDQGLRYLGGLERLRRLCLVSTAVTDAGLVHLVDLKRLEDLDISYTDIGDNGLKTLTRLEELARLDMSRTQVTGEGALPFLGVAPCKMGLDAVHQLADAGDRLADALAGPVHIEQQPCP